MLAKRPKSPKGARNQIISIDEMFEKLLSTEKVMRGTFWFPLTFASIQSFRFSGRLEFTYLRHQDRESALITRPSGSESLPTLLKLKNSYKCFGCFRCIETN